MSTFTSNSKTNNYKAAAATAALLMSGMSGALGASVSTKCTPNGSDPYATGAHVSCCTGNKELLYAWNGNGANSYRCVTDFTNASLKWQDDFNENFDMENTWVPEYGPGPGNGEKEYYVSDSDHAYIKDGQLQLKANFNKETNRWESARFHSKQTFKLGKFETRVQMDATKGAFPAVWMLGDGPWPLSGEIDLVEYQDTWGETPSTLHFGEHNGGNALSYHDNQIKDLQTEYVYTCEWDENTITFYHNGRFIGGYARPDNSNDYNWPYHADGKNDFRYVLNLAVGPEWGSQPSDDQPPMYFNIDYVKYYNF